MSKKTKEQKKAKRKMIIVGIILSAITLFYFVGLIGQIVLKNFHIGNLLVVILMGICLFLFFTKQRESKQCFTLAIILIIIGYINPSLTYGDVLSVGVFILILFYVRSNINYLFEKGVEHGNR